MSEIKRTIHEVERGVDEKGNEYEVERHIEEVEVEPALCNRHKVVKGLDGEHQEEEESSDEDFDIEELV